MLRDSCLAGLRKRAQSVKSDYDSYGEAWGANPKLFYFKAKVLNNSTSPLVNLFNFSNYFLPLPHQ